MERDQLETTERIGDPIRSTKKWWRNSLPRPSSLLLLYLLAPFSKHTDKERRRLVQDLGNTNYCVFVTRTEFDRTTNAELVSSALKKLSIPAYVNERNDICVDGFKMSPSPYNFAPLVHTRSFELIWGLIEGIYVSGSAFKLVSKRAYHHGTMLIDAQLSHLRGVLGTEKVRSLPLFSLSISLNSRF